MLTLENLQSALKFLQRVDLKGVEVPEYCDCVNAISQMIAAGSSLKSDKDYVDSKTCDDQSHRDRRLCDGG